MRRFTRVSKLSLLFLSMVMVVFLMMHFIPGDPVSLLLGDYYIEASLSFLGLGTQPPTPTWGGT